MQKARSRGGRDTRTHKKDTSRAYRSALAAFISRFLRAANYHAQKKGTNVIQCAFTMFSVNWACLTAASGAFAKVDVRSAEWRNYTLVHLCVTRNAEICTLARYAFKFSPPPVTRNNWEMYICKIRYKHCVIRILISKAVRHRRCYPKFYIELYIARFARLNDWNTQLIHKYVNYSFFIYCFRSFLIISCSDSKDTHYIELPFSIDLIESEIVTRSILIVHYCVR